MAESKKQCDRCGKKTIRIASTICGTLCEKCIIEIRKRLNGSMASIKCDAYDRKENKKSEVQND